MIQLHACISTSITCMYIIDLYQLPILLILQTQYADNSFFNERQGVPPNPVKYAAGPELMFRENTSITSTFKRRAACK